MPEAPSLASHGQGLTWVGQTLAESGVNWGNVGKVTGIVQLAIRVTHALVPVMSLCAMDEFHRLGVLRRL